MGRLTDGSCNFYTKENPFITQQQQQNPFKVDKTAETIKFAMNSVFSVANMLATSTGDAKASDTKSPEDIEVEINAILDKYDSIPFDGIVDANISDLKLKLAIKQAKLGQMQADYKADIDAYNLEKDNNIKLNNQLNPVKNEYEKKSIELNAVSTEIANNAKAINTLKQQQANVSSLTDNEAAQNEVKTLQKKIDELISKNEKLAKEQTKLEQEVNSKKAEKEDLEAQLETSNKKLLQLNNEKVEQVTKLEAEIKHFDADVKELDKLDTIENLTNDETDNITKLVKKLSKAKPEDRAACQRELNNALDVYYAKHKVGDNKTIDNLANRGRLVGTLTTASLDSKPTKFDPSSFKFGI